MVAQPQDEEWVAARDLENELGLNRGSLRQAIASGRIPGRKIRVEGLPGKGEMWHTTRQAVAAYIDEHPGAFTRHIRYPKQRTPKTVDADNLVQTLREEGMVEGEDPLFDALDVIEAGIKQLRRTIKGHDRVIRRETIQQLASSLIESSR